MFLFASKEKKYRVYPVFLRNINISSLARENEANRTRIEGENCNFQEVEFRKNAF